MGRGLILKQKEDIKALSEEERGRYIAKADAWLGDTDVSGKNVAQGPEAQLTSTPGRTLSCDLVEPDLSDPPGGRTPKFECEFEVIGKKKSYQVKYASEVRGTLPLRLNDPAGVLTINDNFYEFVPVEEIDAPRRFLLVDELAQGRRYYVFITNFSGLYRYNIHDIVEVTSFHKKTPEIVFVQKGKGITSITGEKLFENQVIEAVQEVARTLAKAPAFHMTFANVEEARYETYVEGDFCEDDLRVFARHLEEALGRLNIEYKAKRESLRLKPLIVRRAMPRAYERFKLWRVEQGVRETQFKMTYLTQERNFVRVIAPA